MFKSASVKRDDAVLPTRYMPTEADMVLPECIDSNYPDVYQGGNVPLTMCAPLPPPISS